MTMFLMMMVGAMTLPACSGDEPSSRGESSSRDESGSDDGGSSSSGSNTDECYDAGWEDCEYYYDPEPEYWDCDSSSDDDAYWDGYCDCEDYYADWWFC